MLEPTSRGRLNPNSTRIIITHSGDPHLLLSTDTLSESIDSEGIEIDEDFLANATGHFESKKHNTFSDNSDSSDGVHAAQALFRADPLAFPASPTEDHCTLYVRTCDLGRVGLLNEDWAVASSYTENRCRLVRIVADDQLVKSRGTVCGSPTLIFNIIGNASWSIDQDHSLVSLRPSPFGQRQPSIPTAKSITIARISTPFSVHRKYQGPFHSSLKSYFSSARQLVKANDILALSLSSQPEFRVPADDEEEDDWGGVVNEIAYFLVTNVEHSVITSATTYKEDDLYAESTLGELGCWVDSSFTRMMQTGFEHARVPDVGSYLELDLQQTRSTYSSLKRHPSSRLFRRDSPFRKLLSLVSACFGDRSGDYQLQLSVLLKGVRGVGKFTTVCWVAQQLGLHVLEVNCFDLVEENSTTTEGTLQSRFDRASSCSPSILVLRGLEALTQTTQPADTGKDPAIANALKDCINKSTLSWKITGFPVLVVATTTDTSFVPPSILSCFKNEIQFEAPNEDERLEMLQTLLSNASLAPDVSLEELAIQTAALVAMDLVDLVFQAKSSSLERAGEGGMKHPLITATDFDYAIKKVRAAYSENIGAPKIPSVTWDDVGGLAHVKADILDTIQLPLEHPELFGDGLKKRSGILLYGPPGTGKTLVAKAVATSCSLNFFSVKGPELLNMYIGESEANVRRVFQRARDAKPCVIFFDELDSVAPKRGNHGDSGGVMDRIVSQLLAEIDGMSSGSSSADVFVIGATNRPDLLDPALLRPGRFDRMLYLGVNQTHDAQLKIIEALTRKFKLHPDLDLSTIAQLCPLNYTGADFYALCSDAMLNAMSRTAQWVDGQLEKLNENPQNNHPYPLTPQYYLAEMVPQDMIQVQVSQEDFLSALRHLVPSVSQLEMEHYAQIQERFSM
ncbi:hypothetical protein AGABI2DRAFT_216898 [Agaricus bisporus var. bisporus H97]|uniref:hypothetical protein n=1 Tax=Agaricus bisporus var. bisporus (strain H97 / ATCC MYA-4626 / FGSC 10389) TaxID=936046 RepID=UPI00029F6022|nr:hypothetical protein AGABI2DRAFT_216898 [Agaricus bisporus var. bisporus H97]EKV50352.1 hypothetical protein AGABI2DRAFT_216898 [Agaricus bisporus var. bisporus H97]